MIKDRQLTTRDRDVLLAVSSLGREAPHSQVVLRVCDIRAAKHRRFAKNPWWYVRVADDLVGKGYLSSQAGRSGTILYNLTSKGALALCDDL